MKREMLRRVNAVCCLLLCGLGRVPSTQGQVLDDMIDAVEGGGATNTDLASALGFYENRPIAAGTGTPTMTSLEDVNRPWRDCKGGRVGTEKYPTGAWGEPAEMNVFRWLLNEAFMCRDSQRNWLVNYRVALRKAPGWTVDGAIAEWERAQFEVNGELVLPRPPVGRMAKGVEDIWPCDLFRKEPCWQERTARAQAVAPSADVPRLFDNFCWAGTTLQEQHDITPELCYPSVAYQGRGCTQDNTNRACFVEDNAEYIVVAHFPWQRPDDSTSYSATKVNGPAKMSRTEGEWSIESLDYVTGSMGKCQVCTTGNTLGEFALGRNMTMTEQRFFAGMETCAGAASELAGLDMYMHAYDSNQQLDISLQSATARSYSHSMFAIRLDVQKAFQDMKDENRKPDAINFVEASRRGMDTAKSKMLKDAFKDCPSIEELTIRSPTFSRDGTQVLDDPCELQRYKGDVKKVYEGIYSDIEPPDESMSHSIETKKLSAVGSRLSEHVLCPYAFTPGCVSWFNSQSRHICNDGIIGKNHSISTWLQDLRINAAPSQTSTLLVFVPSMLTDAGFASAYKLGVVQWSETWDDGVVTYSDIKYSIPPENGPRTVLVTSLMFRIDILLIDAEASGDKWNRAYVFCNCRDRDSIQRVPSPSTGGEVDVADAVYGAVMRQTEADRTTTLVDSSNTGLFHECRICSGREFRKSDPFKRQVCGSVTHTCAPCRDSVGSENSLRSHDGERCILCPRAHLVNEWSSLEQLLRSASEQYGWRYDEDVAPSDKLRRLQTFGSQIVYDHIRGRFIRDGRWTCHICPMGFVLVQDLLSFTCRQLNLVKPELDQALSTWKLSESCSGDALGCDEVTLDEDRTTARVIETGRYLVINTTSQQISEQACPTGVYRHPNDGIINPPLHTGLFRHLCGRPYDSVYLRATLAYCDPSQITSGMSATLCDTWPRLGEKRILDTSTNKFMEITQDTDMATVLLQRIHSYYPTVASSVEWELVREGVEQACGTCAQGKYNSGCNNDGGGSFGTCVACKTSPLPGSWLKHALGHRGCDKWLSPGAAGTSILSGEFVDRDYEDTPCRHVVEVGAGNLYLCPGFCGQLAATGTASFRWWNEPTAANPELVGTRTCAHPGDGTDCQWNGANLGTVDIYKECSTEVPYCPRGFYVNTLKAGCERETILSQPFLVDGANAKCCALCLQNCPEEKMRSNTWQVCPGYTTYDTQDACTAGCDIGYYKQVEIANAGAADEVRTETCAPCTSCEAGLNAV